MPKKPKIPLPGKFLLHLALRFRPLVGGHAPGLPQHFQPKQEHNRRAGVVRVLARHKLRHHKAQQGGHDGHDGEGGDGGEEDGELVVAHGENGGDEEGLVAELRDENDGERLDKAVEEALVLRRVELQLQLLIVQEEVCGVEEDVGECRRFIAVLRFRQLQQIPGLRDMIKGTIRNFFCLRETLVRCSNLAVYALRNLFKSQNIFHIGFQF